MAETRHVLELMSPDIRVIEIALRTYAAVLRAATGEGVATAVAREDANTAAHASALIQEHTKGHCDCRPV